MAVIITVGWDGYCRFEDGIWTGRDVRLVTRLNEHYQAHANPLHPDPDGHAIALARKVFPELDVFHRDRPGRRKYKDPADQAPNWVQCLFDPSVTLLSLQRLFPNVRDRPKK